MADPLNEPWKLTDPSSGYKFPTNDFESYYKSGLDEHGIFDPKRADKRFLVNELYPEKGPDWGWMTALDGWMKRGTAGPSSPITTTGTSGTAAWWTTPSGPSGTLISTPATCVTPGPASSSWTASPMCIRRWTFPSTRKRTASSTPTAEPERAKSGKHLEATAVPNYLSAYDAFFPVVEESGAVEFLRDKAREYKLDNPKDTADAVRKNIEDNLVRQIFPAVKNAQIRGNFGMHQRALAMAAVVLDEPGTTEAWIDWVFQTGDSIPPPTGT